MWNLVKVWWTCFTRECSYPNFLQKTWSQGSHCANLAEQMQCTDLQHINITKSLSWLLRLLTSVANGFLKMLTFRSFRIHFSVFSLLSQGQMWKPSTTAWLCSIITGSTASVAHRTAGYVVQETQRETWCHQNREYCCLCSFSSFFNIDHTAQLGISFWLFRIALFFHNIRFTGFLCKWFWCYNNHTLWNHANLPMATKQHAPGCVATADCERLIDAVLSRDQ